MKGPWDNYPDQPHLDQAPKGPWENYADQPHLDSMRDAPNDGVDALRNITDNPLGLTRAIGAINDVAPDIKKGILTNDPVGIVGSTARSVFPVVGGTLAAAAAAPSGPGAIAAWGLGSAGAEGARQALVQAYAGKSGLPFSSPREIIGQMATQGIVGAATEGLSQLAQAAAPVATKVGAQTIRVMSGTPEKTAARALSYPSRLLNAPSMDEARSAYQAFEQNRGISGLGSLVEKTGKFPSEGQMEDMLFGAAQKAANGTATPEELYQASQAASNLSQMAKMGNPRYAMLDRAISKAKDSVNVALEAVHPEYASVRSNYADAKMAEAFSSLLPLNKNLSPNVLRPTAAVAGALGAVASGNPWPALGLPLISPMTYGTAIKAAALAGKVPAGVYRVGVQSGASRAATSLANAYLGPATP